MRHSTILEYLDRLPPNVCRLIAREHRRLLTDKEIGARCGRTAQWVGKMSRRKTFADVTVKDAEAFRLGCGITLRNERRHIAYLLNALARGARGFVHLNLLDKDRAKRLQHVVD